MIAPTSPIELLYKLKFEDNYRAFALRSPARNFWFDKWQVQCYDYGNILKGKE